MKKKFMAFAITAIAVIAMGTIVPVMAYYDYDDADYNGYYNESDYYYGYYDDGYENETDTTRQQTKVGNITDYSGDTLTVDSLVLNISDDTIIIDYNGQKAEIDDRYTDRVRVFHANFKTASEPPQTTAYIVVINLPMYTTSPYKYVVESVDIDDEYNTVRVAVDGGAIFLLTPYTEFSAAGSQYMDMEELEEGDVLLIWHDDDEDTSYANATRVMFIRHADEDEPQDDTPYEADAEPEYHTPEQYIYEETPYEYPPSDYTGYNYYPAYEHIPVHQQPFAVPGTGINRNGVEFFPVREAATTAGFSVQWYSTTGSAILSGHGGTITLTNNSKTFQDNGAVNSLPAAVFIENGVMYAPYSFFEHLR